MLVLIGIMTAMIIPELTGTYEDALLRSTGRELANACGLAYSRAVTRQQPHRVRLDPVTHHYAIEKRYRDAHGEGFSPVRDLPGGEGTLDARISIAFRRPGEEVAAPTDSSSPLATQIAASVSDGDEGLLFYPDGTAEAREIQLQDRAGFRLALRIHPTTGRVQIKELERQ